MMRAAFDRRRRTIHPCSTRSTASTCLVPEGAFYAFPSVEGLLGRSHPRARPPTSSAELAELAIDEAKVAVVPGEAFGAPGYFRMSYALGDDDLVEGRLPPGQAVRRGRAEDGSVTPRRTAAESEIVHRKEHHG